MMGKILCVRFSTADEMVNPHLARLTAIAWNNPARPQQLLPLARSPNQD
jgi:hypothetical protein